MGEEREEERQNAQGGHAVPGVALGCAKHVTRRYPQAVCGERGGGASLQRRRGSRSGPQQVVAATVRPHLSLLTCKA